MSCQGLAGMDRAQIEAALKPILIKNSALSIKSVAAGDSLVEDLGFDSLAFLMTLADLEARFDAKFPVERAEDLRTLRFEDLVLFVERELARQSADS